MKTTKEIYNIDPTKFATMLYLDVLEAKKIAAVRKFRAAYTEMFALPYDKSSLKRRAELQVIADVASKALEYIELWQQEVKGHTV